MKRLMMPHEFRSIFHILRQCLPMEVAVAFNAKYGRHCIPLKWNTETNQAEPQLYDACCKKKCRTCKFPIPADVTVDAKIHSLIQIQNKNGKPLDLKHFYNKCIPNLPSNLTCPSCRCTDKRTLVLSTYSYPSSAGGRNTLLTFTPRDVDDESSDESSSDTDNDDDDEQEDDYAVEPQRKKQRLDKEQNDDAASSFAFPPVYEDLALPTKWEPLERTPDAKHVIAIHCVSCQKFGMVAPAGPCCNDNFPCHERTRQVTIAARAATIGGVFMRRKCSNEACLHAVSCEACSRAVEHPMFDRDIVEASESGEASDDNDNGNEADDDDAGDSATDGNAMIVNHKTRCQTCNLRYCNECAWLSTICHHW